MTDAVRPMKYRPPPEKPLFIPLKGEFYDAFEAGTKDTEFRRYGARWNERTCAVGRPVVLSYGYGKRRRMRGVVAGFWIKKALEMGTSWEACYGDRKGFAACIRIALQPGEHR